MNVATTFEHYFAQEIFCTSADQGLESVLHQLDTIADIAEYWFLEILL